MAKSSETSSPTSLKDAFASLDVKSIVGDLTGFLQGVAADVTDPRFQDVLTKLAIDALAVQRMKASGANPELVKQAEDAIAARVQSVTKIPGLIVAGRQIEVTTMIQKGITLVSSVAFNFLRAYAGLPPVPATP